MDNRAIAIAGAGLVIIGLFVPVVTLPFVGSVSIFANGTNVFAYLLLTLAGLAAYAAYKNKIHDVFAPAVATVVLVAAKFVELQIHIAAMKDEIAATVEGNPFASMVEGLASAVQIQWGWLVLTAGSASMIYAALQARKVASDEETELDAIAAIRYGSVAIAVAGLAWMSYNARIADDRSGGNAAEASLGASEIDSPFEEANENGENARAETAYMRDHVEIYDLSARYMDSMLDGRVPGVEFKIRNNGNRSLDKVEVTVVFYDKDGNAIAEDSFLPVLAGGYDPDPPLRPGYIWQQERGRFYSAKSVPSEWQAGKATAKVTAIEFSDEPTP